MSRLFVHAPRAARRIVALGAFLLAPLTFSSATIAAQAPPQFTTSAAATPSQISPGGTLTLAVSATSATAANALVDLEVYSPTATKVFQKVFSTQSFAAGQSRAYGSAWQTPSAGALGTYVVKIGVFSPDWSSLYAWNDHAASLTFMASAAGYAPAVLADAPLAYWRLDEISGSQQAADGSGHGYGALVNGGVTLGVVGALANSSSTAAQFDGTSGMLAASVPRPAGAVTLEGWVKPTPLPALHSHYFGLRNDTNADFYILQLAGTNTLEARFRNNTGAAFTLSAQISPGLWHHLVFAYDARGVLELYVDGRLATSTVGVWGALSAGTDKLRIGTTTATVDEVALYGSMLDVDRVMAHHDLGTGIQTHQPAITGHWLGAYVSGFPNSDTPLDTFAGEVGQMPSVTMWYQDFTHGGFNRFQMDAARSRATIPMVTLMPTDSLANILAGTYDTALHQWARDAAAWRHPFFLRLGHEMNGDWYAYGTANGHNGNTPVQFVAMWQHVHDIFTAEGATAAIWVWSPNTLYPGQPSYASLYPGDSYVDWLALDGYNWGADPSGTVWQTFSQVFSPSYQAIAAVSTTKPIMLGEFASAEGGGDKAAWIRSAYLQEAPSSFPRLSGFVWFGEQKERNWEIPSSPSALAAYQAVVASPAYRR